MNKLKCLRGELENDGLETAQWLEDRSPEYSNECKAVIK